MNTLGMRAEVSSARGRPIRRSAVASWVLYDLANTIFSMGIVSLYFSLFVREQVGRGTGGQRLRPDHRDLHGHHLRGVAAARRHDRPRAAAHAVPGREHAHLRGASRLLLARIGFCAHGRSVHHRQRRLPGRPAVLRRAAAGGDAPRRIADASAASASASATSARTWRVGLGLLLGDRRHCRGSSSLHRGGVSGVLAYPVSSS